MKNKNLLLTLSILLCLGLIYFFTLFGITKVPFIDANKILLNKLFHLPISLEGISEGEIAIVFNLRLPRVILAFLTGSALAVCGCLYQAIFKNPMADPFILGVSSGAALGAAIGIVLNLQFYLLGLSSTSLLAFIGAFLTILMVYFAARQGNRVPVGSLLLSGVAFSQTLTALMSLLMLYNLKNMQEIMFWTMGSLNGKGFKEIFTILPYLFIGYLFIIPLTRQLDIMLLGEDTAYELGVDSERLKKLVLFSSSLITAAVVSVTGIIGFVGLIVPHIVRIFTGPKHSLLLPFSFIFGGTFLIFCDSISRSLLAQEIPVGIITACFGGPFFIYLLTRRKKGI